MADYLKKRPMLLCAAVSAVLCIVGFYCPPAVFFCGIALIILFFVSLYLRRPAETVVAFILAVTAAGILLTSSRAAELSGLDGSAAKGEFTVVSEPEKHGTANTVKLEATSCDTLKKGTKLICTDYSLTPLEYGNRIQATVSLSQLSLGTQKRSYYSEGIFLRGRLRDIRVEKGNDDPVLQKIRNVRSYIKNTLFSAMSRDEAATLTAVTIGDRSYFTDEFYANVKKAGDSHVMVVSGMHLSVIVGLTAVAVKKYFYNKYLRALTMLATVLFMAAVCGFTKSILRAGFCSLFLAVSILSERDNTTENSLGGAAALLFMISPFTVFSVSFQLSFLSTLGIVSVAMPCLKFIKDNRLLKTDIAFTLFSAVSVTLAATLFTLPISIYTFGYVSNVSVFTNLLIDAAAGIALQISAVALALNLIFPYLSRLLFIAAEFTAAYINRIINLFGSLPFAVSDIGTPEFYASLLIIISVVAALFAFKRHLDRLKLNEMYRKISSERGRKFRWQ